MSNNIIQDTTHEFETLLDTWQNFELDHKASTEDVAKLITVAETASNASAWMWAELANLLVDHGGFKTEKGAKAEAKKARIKADLGCYPGSTREFVPIWLERNGYSMLFDRSFLRRGSKTDH